MMLLLAWLWCARHRALTIIRRALPRAATTPATTPAGRAPLSAGAPEAPALSPVPGAGASPQRDDTWVRAQFAPVPRPDGPAPEPGSQPASVRDTAALRVPAGIRVPRYANPDWLCHPRASVAERRIAVRHAAAAAEWRIDRARRCSA